MRSDQEMLLSSMSNISSNHKPSSEKFNVEEWLKTIDIWDKKYDYVMHNSHWLTSKWEPSCEQCRANGQKPPSPEVVNKTNNHHTTTITTTTTTTTNTAGIGNSIASNSQTAASEQTAGKDMTTSSPVSNRLSINSTFNEPTLKNDQTTNLHNNMDISPQPAGPPPVTIAMTPIAPADISKRHFVTPFTNTKHAAMAGNETYQRSTRMTTRRLANQAANQDLIDLNETFDLYRSALADTPQLAQHETPGRNNGQTQAEQNQEQQQPQLLHTQSQQHQQQLISQSQQQMHQIQQQSQQQQLHLQQQQQQQLGISSRIPKIPVRLSNAFGYGTHH